MFVFKMPKPVKITGVSSMITKSFVNGIIPSIKPTDEEIESALTVLGMTKDTVCCAYCGDKYTEWDHLNPLVKNKRPTGYISEIHNLIPSCGPCNQSKGNKNWLEWMTSSAELSPMTRGVPDLNGRIERLKQYVKTFEPIKIDFKQIIGEDLWNKHWENYEAIIATIRAAQETSDQVKNLLAKSVNKKP